MQLSDFQRKNVDATFQFSNTRLEGFLRRPLRLLEQQIDRGAGHFGDAPNTVNEAEFTETFVFFRAQAEADHPGSEFSGHEEFG